jgi:mannose-6-phosphate isomerase-like protein (cupin superfamily)
MRLPTTAAIVLLVFAVGASSQDGAPVNTTYDPDRAFFLSADDVAARAAEFDPGVAYSNTTVLERADPASPTGLAYRLAVDRRTPPQRAAAHTNEAELWSIVSGSGEITTGGRIVETTGADGTVERRIEGGTVHRVSAGDYLMIPETVPHQVTAFEPSLLIVTFEFPRG